MNGPRNLPIHQRPMTVERPMPPTNPVRPPPSAARVVVLVPIYQEQPSTAEQWALSHSLSLLQGRHIRFIGPERLKTDWYQARFPHIPLTLFAAPAFNSIQEYNRLLLNPAFYSLYADYEFMLVLQTDALLLRDELDDWCALPFDYIGAPWPKMYELFVNTGRLEGSFGKHVRVGVGNGGLSLRRIQKCRALLHEFPVENDYFQKTGSSEDLFFSVMGSLSNDFIIPNEITASRFAMEGRPSYYYQINGGHLPMGTHAWEKNEPSFWRQHVDGLQALDAHLNALPARS